MSNDLESKCSGLQKEVEYWKSEASRLSSQLEESEDLISCNKEIENELESQMKELEGEVKSLRHQNTSLTFERESLTERLQQQSAAHYKEFSDLQDQHSKSQVSNSELVKDVRELEQKNDDLERTNRMIIATLADFESRVDKECEKNAFLESELVEKTDMEVTVQRLRDEARDLSEELHVRQLKHQTSIGSNHGDHEKLDNKENTKDSPQMMTPSGKLGNCKRLSAMSNGVNNNNISSSPTTSTPRSHNDNRRVLLTGNMDTLQSSPRVYALSIVGDLLRKVGALESKLASCRNIVLDQSTRSHSTASSMTTTSSTSHNANENNNNLHQKATPKLKV